MTPLFFAAARAVRSLAAPGMFGVMVWSVLITLAALAAFIAAAAVFFGWLATQWSAPWVGWLGAGGSSMLAWFLFPAIMPVIVNFFDERIAGIIERADYPDVRPLDPPFWPEFRHDARFTLFTLTVNLLALPLYLVPVINIFLFYLLNGYLLGREFFVMAGRRHMPLADVEALRQRHSRQVTLLGAGLALMATIPFANLLAPFWGIAAMTHLFHKLAPQPHHSFAPAVRHLTDN